MSRTVAPPADKACAACPWRTVNHGKPTAVHVRTRSRGNVDDWYGDANRRRLWNGIRLGDAPGMTCHPTDGEHGPVPEDTVTRECTGAWLVIGREVAALEEAGNHTAYRRGRKYAMSVAGFLNAVTALLPPALGGRGLNKVTIPEDDGISIGLGTGR